MAHTDHTCVVILAQNYAGSKRKSCKIMTVKMFLVWDKAKPNAGNIRGLDIMAVMRGVVCSVR
jgi:predicted ABC-class ATPase